MRAVVQDRFGGPEVLRVVTDAPVPEPIPTEVQVQVHYAGVNPVDAKTRAGASVAPFLGGFPLTVGWDVAGVVSRVGVGVNRFAVGDRVFGMPRFPRAANGYAELVTAPSRQLVAVPDGLDLATAAAIPLPATTAYQVLVDTAALQAGQTVLVLGAGGSVGAIAVQLALHRGARVIGTATGPRLARLLELGMHRGIDYAAEEFDAPVLADGRLGEIDVVVDLVGAGQAERATRVTRPGGLVVGVPSGQQGALADAAAAAGVRSTNLIVEPDRMALEHAAALLAQGALVVAPPRVVPLSQVVRVHEELETGAPKTVLDVTG